MSLYEGHCITLQWRDDVGPQNRLYDYGLVYKKWLEVKTYQGTGRHFGISGTSVAKIVLKYRAEHGM